MSEFFGLLVAEGWFWYKFSATSVSYMCELVQVASWARVRFTFLQSAWRGEHDDRKGHHYYTRRTGQKRRIVVMTLAVIMLRKKMNRRPERNKYVHTKNAQVWLPLSRA